MGWGGNYQPLTLGEAVPRLDVADEADRCAKPEPLNLRLESFQLFAVAGKRQRDRLAVGPQPRHRIDQEVGALDVLELTDIDDIGGVGRSDYGIEFVRGHTIEHAAREPARKADGALISIAREGAFEQE